MMFDVIGLKPPDIARSGREEDLMRAAAGSTAAENDGQAAV